jgi:hypothetical protein
MQDEVCVPAKRTTRAKRARAVAAPGTGARSRSGAHFRKPVGRDAEKVRRPAGDAGEEREDRERHRRHRRLPGAADNDFMRDVVVHVPHVRIHVGEET